MIKWLKKMWHSNQHHWDIESQLRETNEQAAERHKAMWEALTK